MPNGALRILLVGEPSLVAGLEGTISGDCAIVEADPPGAYRRLLAGEWFDAVVCDASTATNNEELLLATARELPDPPVFVVMGECATPADAVLPRAFAIADLLGLLEMFATRRSHETTQPLPRICKP